MDEELHIYMLSRCLSKLERNRAGMEDRFYEENDGVEFGKLANDLRVAVIFPLRSVRKLLALFRSKKHRPLRGRCKEMTPHIGQGESGVGEKAASSCFASSRAA